MKKNIFLALDFNSLEKALDTTRKLKDQIAGVKIGTELYAICGTEGLKKFKEIGVEIFLDLKLHDIPNQVKKTINAMIIPALIFEISPLITSLGFSTIAIPSFSPISCCS